MMSYSTSFQTHYGYGSSKQALSPTQGHAHRSKRAGHNRTTKGQKKRTLIANVLFTFLSLVALIIVAIIAYDRWYGLF